MGALLQDVRYALRSLRRSPAFTAVALLTIALGVGANAAMFSVVNGVLLRPLPYAEPDRLMRLHQASPEHGLVDGPISYLDLQDWRERTRSFATMAAYFASTQIATGHGEAAELSTAYVTDGFFEVLGTPVQHGRPLLDSELHEGTYSVVISDRLWRSRFGGDPGVIGMRLQLGEVGYEVVGVAPPHLRYPTAETDLWVPFAVLTPDQIGPTVRDNRLLEGVARLAPGVTPERARADLAAIAAQLSAEYPDTNAGWNAATVLPLREAIVGDVDRALLVVLGGVGFILLIGCANLANLLLARGSGRSHEFAVRTAVGAGRARLLRQLLTESVVLALIGGAIGLVVSIWGVQTFLAMSADTLPRVDEIALDSRVIGFGLLLTLLTGLLFGLPPAIRAASADPHAELRGGRGAVGGGGGRLRNALVVAEVALAVVLVVGAGLMARSFLELRAVEPGFDPDGVLAVTLRINVAGVAEGQVTNHIVNRRNEILDRLRALPGVSDAGSVNALPLQSNRWERFEFFRADGSGSPDGVALRADLAMVSPDYLQTMRIPLLRGDALPRELPSEGPVPVLISEGGAQRFWPDTDPVGQVVRTSWSEAVVIGVVGNVRNFGLDTEPAPAVYLPQAIGPRILSTLVIRTAGDPGALAGPARAAIHEIDPNQPVRSISPLREIMAESLARDRFFTVLFALFGGLAFMLAAVGIYGVIAYSVNQRTREIGVRMALGANALHVHRSIVTGALTMVLGGIALGGIAAIALTRLLGGLLYEISPTDPLTFVSVGVLLTLVGALASYLPARRAARVDPLVALRAD